MTQKGLVWERNYIYAILPLLLIKIKYLLLVVAVVQVNMLMNFKNCIEDEECPVPEEVREAMLAFHNALLAHCGQFSSTLSSLANISVENPHCRFQI